MTPQSVLFIVGVVLIVAAVVMVGLAVWTYRALDIKGVRDDLSGVARAPRAELPRRSDEKIDRPCLFRRVWQGEARQRERAPEAAPPAAAQRPHASSPPAAPAPARRQLPRRPMTRRRFWARRRHRASRSRSVW